MDNLLDREHQDKIVVEAMGYMHTQDIREYMYSCDKQELLVVAAYGLKPYKDGDQWCVLLGDNIQVEVIGFGNTPIEAIRNFNKEFYNNK